jgi:hypothetical protein
MAVFLHVDDFPKVILSKKILDSSLFAVLIGCDIMTSSAARAVGQGD